LDLERDRIRQPGQFRFAAARDLSDLQCVINGQLVSTLLQSALGDFMAKDQSKQIVSTSQIQ
jgi:hypothetical protein